MSKAQVPPSAASRKTVPEMVARKEAGKKISMVTCYDAAFARLIESTGIDIILVGDSLGNVVMGLDNTLGVTLDAMLHHTACVSRVAKRPLVCGDMPFLSYQITIEEAVRNAGRFVQEAGAEAVKLEGGRERVPAIKAITEAGIPVMGHLGLTPQSIHKFGGHRVQAREAEAAARLIEDAKALESAGAFAIVLELVPAKLAAEVTKAVGIPTIGIGAGAECDGQVLVLHDLLGFDDDFNPRHLKRYENLSGLVTKALDGYDQDVKDGVFPTAEHSF